MAQGQRIARNAEAISIKRQATLHTPKYALTLPHSKSSPMTPHLPLAAMERPFRSPLLATVTVPRGIALRDDSASTWQGQGL